MCSSVPSTVNSYALNRLDEWQHPLLCSSRLFLGRVTVQDKNQKIYLILAIKGNRAEEIMSKEAQLLKDI